MKPQMFPRHITQRVTEPTVEEIRQARKTANLTQTEAAQMISAAKHAPHKTWGGYEAPGGAAPEGRPNHRAIPLAAWELFLLLTGQHQTLEITRRDKSRSKSSQGTAETLLGKDGK